MNTIILYIIICAIAAVSFLLGVRVGSYKQNEYDGDFIINETNPEKDTISIQFHHNILNLFNKKEVCFKVIHETEEMSSKNR